MAKRPQVDLGLQEPQITPAAEPVNLYYSPSLPAPLMKQVVDLSPLSGTLAQIADAEQKKQAERDRVAGKQLYQSLSPDKTIALQQADTSLTEAEKGRKDNQRAWASLVAKGVVPESASPWTRVGFFETAAADLMNGYSSRLNAQLESVSAAVDANGNPVAPGDAKKIISDEWNKIAGHPIFQDFYGGRVAADMKEKIDRSFEAQAADAQGAAQADFRRTQIVNSLSSTMNAWAVSGDVWSPDQYAQLSALANEQMHGRSMKDVSGAFMQAIEFVAAKENEIDPHSAVTFLRNAARIQSGNTTIGEDTRTGAKLAELRKQYETEAETREAKDRAQRINKENDTVRDAVTQALQVMSKAEVDGTSPSAAVNTFITDAQAKNTYGDLTGRVVAELKSIAEAKADVSAPGLAEDMHRRAALGETTGMIEEAQAMLRSGKLSVKDYTGVVADVRSRTDITPILEGNDAFVAQRAALSRALTSTNVPTELRGSLDQLAADKEASFVSDAAAFAKTVAGQPDAKDRVRSWAMDRAAKDKADYAAEEQKIVDSRKQYTTSIRTKLQRHEPAEAEIQAASDAGAITLSEAGEFGATSSLLSDWTWYKDRSEYKAAEQDIQMAAMQAVNDNFGKPGEASAQLGDMLTLSRRMLSDKYSEWLSAELPGMPTAEIAGKSRAALRTISDEVVKELGNAARERAKRLIAGGKDISSAVVEGQEAPKGAPSDYEATAAAFATAGRPAFTQILNKGRSTIVDANIYSKLDGLSLSSWFHTRRPGVEDAVLTEAARLSKSGLDPVEVQKAAHSMAKDLVVPWQDAVSGKLTFAPSATSVYHADSLVARSFARVDVERARAGILPTLSGLFADSGGRASAFDEGELNALAKKAVPGSPLDSAVRDAISTLSAAKASKAVSFPFDPALVDPMTTPFFRSMSELDVWAGDGKVGDAQSKLLGLLGRPQTPEGLAQFYKAQALAVLRTNPDAPVVTKEKK